MAKMTRRDALAGAAANILVVKPGTAFGSQANSAVSFGIIGTGGRGSYVGTHMANDPRTRSPPSATYIRTARQGQDQYPRR